MLKQNKKIGVSQKAIIVRNGKILALRRSDTHPRRPKGWDIPGGDLEFGEDPSKGIIREIKEETGLAVSDLKTVGAVSRINDLNEFWVTIFYSAKTKTGKVKLSWEHDDYKWLSFGEFQKTDAVSAVKRAVKKFIGKK